MDSTSNSLRVTEHVTTSQTQHHYQATAVPIASTYKTLQELNWRYLILMTESMTNSEIIVVHHDSLFQLLKNGSKPKNSLECIDTLPELS